MKGEIPVRYQVKQDDTPRFCPGDVIFSYSADAINSIKRYVVDHAYPGDVYSVVRLNDNGKRTGAPIRLNSSVSKNFHHDELVTNLIEQLKTTME